MQAEVILRKNPNVVSRIIGNEMILLPIYRNSDEINCIYTLNKSASFVWENLDGKTPLGKIKQKILKEFDAKPEEIDKELEKLIKELKEIKALD